jgi:hypothetical protein
MRRAFFHASLRIPGIPSDMVALLAGGPSGLEAVRKGSTAAQRLPLSGVRLEAPVLRPRKFLGLGGSYGSHVKEIAHFMAPPQTSDLVQQASHMRKRPV